MNTSPVTSPEDRKRGTFITLLAAFTGLATAIWTNFLLGFEKGDGATVVFILVGVPTYYLIMLAYQVRYAVRALRVERKPLHVRSLVRAIRR